MALYGAPDMTVPTCASCRFSVPEEAPFTAVLKFSAEEVTISLLTVEIFSFSNHHRAFVLARGTRTDLIFAS